MKNLKLSLFLIFFLTPFNSYAGYGSGELKLSDNAVYSFQKYLEGKKGKPMRFFISIDGKTTHWWYCPYSQCEVMGDTQEAKRCTKRAGVECKTFAVRRSIKWDNGIDKRALKIKFTSKDSIQEIKDKLTQLGFYGEGSINSSSSKSDDKKSSNNITERLQTLNNMYKKGLLTEEEFKKAKQKLLN
tara:strand:+ start:270 stop:827 length:558 start_codon:yes stop_codon:yes gene_type:complete